MAETQVTAPGSTRHIVFCMKVIPGVEEAGRAGGLRKAWTTVVPPRFLVGIAE